MDIEFSEPSEAPVSPEEARIEGIRVEAYPDGRRLKIHLEITPFQVRPNLEILLQSPEGIEVASTRIIEAMEPSMRITLHLRDSPQKGLYTLFVKLSFEEPVLATQERQITFELTPPQGTSEGD